MIWMMCTAARGGMRSVVEGYERDGLFSKHGVRLLFTHVEGSAVQRVAVAAKALALFFWALVNKRVSIAHIHMAMRGSFWRKSLFASLARLFGRPVILHLHGSEMQPFYFSQGALGRALIKAQLTKASAVFVLSQSWRSFVLEVAPDCRVEVLPNYVAVGGRDQAAAQAADQAMTNKEFSFLFMGILGKRKGIFDLLPAFSVALQSNPKMRLVVGGNGDIDGAKALADNLQISQQVDFVGWVSGDAKKTLLAQCDAFVLPSYNEGLPMAILEAMAVAKPVISTRVGGIPELIHDGDQGLLIEPGDQPGLTAALLRLANQPAVAKQMGEAGLATVVNGYSETVILPRIGELYAALGHHS